MKNMGQTDAIVFQFTSQDVSSLSNVPVKEVISRYISKKQIVCIPLSALSPDLINEIGIVLKFKDLRKYQYLIIRLSLLNE